MTGRKRKMEIWKIELEEGEENSTQWMCRSLFISYLFFFTDGGVRPLSLNVKILVSWCQAAITLEQPPWTSGYELWILLSNVAYKQALKLLSPRFIWVPSCLGSSSPLALRTSWTPSVRFIFTPFPASVSWCHWDIVLWSLSPAFNLSSWRTRLSHNHQIQCSGHWVFH